MDSFLGVIGARGELWLTRALSLLVGASGLAILLAARSRRVTREIVIFGVILAFGLTFIDVYYSSLGTISDVYLVDAVVQLVLVGIWLGDRKALVAVTARSARSAGPSGQPGPEGVPRAARADRFLSRLALVRRRRARTGPHDKRETPPREKKAEGR